MPDTTTLRALTLHRPWAEAFCRFGKDVENRTWDPPVWLLGRYFALHAGSAWDRAGADWMSDFGMTPDSDAPKGIVAVARLLGVVESKRLGSITEAKLLEHNKVDGAYIIAHTVTMGPATIARKAASSIWMTTPKVWVLGRVHELPEPIEVGGAQRLWKVKREHEVEIRRQLPGVLDR